MITSHAARVRRHGRRQQDPDHGRFPTVYNQLRKMRARAHVFLLSPAYCGGRRAGMLLRPGAASDLAVSLRSGSLTLGDAFTFLSGLYFRGKLTYARAFARSASEGSPGTMIITPTRGLMAPEAPVSADLLREFAGVDVAADDERYRLPLERDLARLSAELPAGSRVVLLGSIASDKYVSVLIRALGDRLHYPPSFIGRGDMSRGGLLLRSARASTELEYQRLESDTVRRGRRPPKLAPLAPSPAIVRRRSLRLERVL